MPATTPKHLIRYPVAGDPANVLADYFANLANDVDNKMSLDSEPYFGKNYITTGVVGTNGAITNPSGLNIAVTAGRAMINGKAFEFAASGNILLGASTTSRIWLTATFVSNRYVSHSWSVRTDFVVPANSVLVGEVVTNATVPTLMQSTFRGVISPGRLVQVVKSNPVGSTLVANQAIGSALDFCHDGVTPVRVMMETPRFYSGATIDFSGALRVTTDSNTFKVWRKNFAGTTLLDSAVIVANGSDLGALLGRKLIGLVANASTGAVAMTFEEVVMTAHFDF